MHQAALQLACANVIVFLSIHPCRPTHVYTNKSYRVVRKYKFEDYLQSLRGRKLGILDLRLNFFITR